VSYACIIYVNVMEIFVSTGMRYAEKNGCRFVDQFTSLCHKQTLVYRRNLQATLLRIFSPLFFMFLLWLLDLAFRTDNQNISAFTTQENPEVFPVGGVPACEDDLYISQPCWDFLYSPNTSEVANTIVRNMMARNPGRPISPERVLGFESIDQSNAYLRENIEKVLGGVHFLVDGDETTGIDYVLLSNVTVKVFKNTFQDPTFFFTLPMQMLAEQEIAAYQWAESGKATPLEWNVSYSQFAHPTTGSINIVGQAMGPFIFAANMFNFVLLMSSVVGEKEKGLRQAMQASGMLDSAFWCSWIFIEIIISTVFSLLLIAFGAMFQFDFFLKNAFGNVFLLFLLFQWAMMGLAFLLAPFIQKTSGAINAGFIVFLVGWVFQAAIAFSFPYTPDYIGSIPIVTAIFTLIPSNPLAKGTIDLGAAAEEEKGISWPRRNEYCQNLDNTTAEDALFATDPNGYWDFNCVFPLGTIMGVLALEFVVYTALGIYLDNVLPNENGVRKKWWYIVSPSYWGIGAEKARNRRALAPPVACPMEHVTQDDDVLAEEAAMKELIEHRDSASKGDLSSAIDWNMAALEVFGLQKVFERSWLRSLKQKCSCFKRKKKAGSQQTSKEFWAIKGSWFGINQDQLFCLLGPNGAGKSTTINCLTGVLPPTGGDALIHGESITAPGGMDRIRASMGVCPQFDILWGELTGMEHLHIYGCIKGLSRKNVAIQAAELLESVKLTDAAHIKTSAYSGGMRRRLSVAISLLGDPLIVYLDEPTTGMDPISRRQVWDAIESAKKGRVIVLTTHSMEEADILGDQIAIMARGKIRAFGSSLRLKQKFGSGYQISLSFAKDQDAGIGELFEKELGLAAPEEVVGTYIVYGIPKDIEGKLPDFLNLLDSKKTELGILDVQINMTSLEEVFLAIAKRAEIESAEAEGGATEEVQLEDGTMLEVPLGEEVAIQESTGRKFSIKWAQDESGQLQVLSWSEISPE